MTYIAIGCTALTAAIFALVGFIAVRNPVMFKTGLRNIPRRPAQTALIVIGLMLSTLIMTAAFGTGDTLSRSITSEVYGTLGEADEIIEWDSSEQAAPIEQQVIPLTDVDQWRSQLADDEDIEAFVPYLSEQLPMQNPRTGLNEFSARLVAFRTDDAAALGGLRDVEGRSVTLSGNEVAINEKLAGEIDARPGDVVVAFYNLQPVQLQVKAIVPNNVLGGAFDAQRKQGATVDFAFLSELTDKGENADGVFVSNTGGVKAGLEHADAAKEKLERVTEGRPYQVIAAKADGIETAELFGSVFTTFFVVLGLFSIAAGILLIFLIFVMLAAERKPEMGMARAVGAKRRQLVESFLAEGMGYDLGSAVVGLFAGMGVTLAMVAIVRAAAGDQLGLELSVTFTARSLLVAFCLGIIATFIVIFFSSWRASRLNIVAAIRDLPESRPINPEAATWTGYLRAVLNAMAALGILALSLLLALRFRDYWPVFAVAAIFGLPGPWLAMLRNHEFGAPTTERRFGERLPIWPIILGVVTAPLAIGVFILVGYGLAVLLVYLTRDKKPRSLPTWLILLGVLVAPLASILASLQTRGRPVAWSVGAGTVGAVIGAVMVQWGLESNGMFLFAGGISLIFFWAAVSLRYFHVHERLSFTITSALLLALWYLLPGRLLEWLIGELNGDVEMFFLSGVVMVTSGVFIVVYNADIILPAIGALGNRFGRIVPAIKTGVAYPLTARFRTGMTMAMIGLIMFALVVNATLNSNFAAIFLNEDSKGGFDVQLLVNNNNRLAGFEEVLERSGADRDAVRAAAEARIAFPFEAEVQNRDGKENDDGEVRDFSRFAFFGVDETFLRSTTIPLKLRAAGYESDRDIWDAIASDPSLAVLPASVTAPQDGFGPPGAGDLLQLDPLSAEFEPFTLDLRDPTGRVTTITVIGQMKESVETFFPAAITHRDTVLAAFPDSGGQRFYIALNDGVDAEDFAKQLESGLVQVSADSFEKLLDEQQELQNGFLLVFQGFMGLGLIVGIAALSVVASRAVVERRQQIGMLRAIGYKRRMVALSFLFESGFIATSGVLLGLLLGVSLAWVLVTSGAVGEESRDIAFRVPWLQLTLIAGIALTASLVMTFLPARSASRVPVAEALRYE